MKTVIAIILAGLFVNAQAQTVVEPILPAHIVGKNILDSLDTPLGTFTGEMTCGSIKLPTVNYTMSSSDSIVRFDIKLVNIRSDVKEFSISAPENIYSYMSVNTLNTYIGSVTKEKNPSTNPLDLDKAPYIWKTKREQIVTGTNIMVLPKIVNNTIVTQLCYAQNNLSGFKKFSPIDSDLENSPQAKKIEIDLPQTNSNSIFREVVLVPNKENTIVLSPSVSLKIKANIVRYNTGI